MITSSMLPSSISVLRESMKSSSKFSNSSTYNASEKQTNKTISIGELNAQKDAGFNIKPLKTYNKHNYMILNSKSSHESLTHPTKETKRFSV